MVTVTPAMFLISLCSGAVAAYFAKKRGRDPFLWFCIGMFFGALGVLALFIPIGRKKKPSPKRRRAVRRPQPHYIEGPSGCFWYYLDGEQQKGPVSLVALSQAWKRGEVKPSTYVWHEELTEWKTLQELIRTPTP